jgi:hypothetical protein
LKRTGTILLLILIGYSQWGHDLQFIIRQWQMKEAAREAWIASLPDRSFLRISSAEIDAHGKWEDGGRECWYQGHLYDIIRQHKTAGTTWLFLLDDDNEERLIRQSGECTKANLDHPDKQSARPLSSAIGDLVCEAAHWRIPPPPVSPRRYSFHGTDPLPAADADIVSPPPKG